jgi:lipoate-protein ligase A
VPETVGVARIAHGDAAANRAAIPDISFADVETAELGLLCQQQLAEQLGSDDERRLLVWRAPRALIVGRSDSRLPNFSVAANQLRDEGWPVLIRRSGGTACQVSRGTLQIALARIVVPKVTIETAYMELAGFIGAVLKSYGLEAEIGEKPNAFCPGRYDISINGRKIAGLSQHWRRCNGRVTATTAATLVVDHDREELARIVNLFYQSAGGQARCSVSAIGDMRSALQQTSWSGKSLTRDVRERIGDLWKPAQP